MKIKEKMTTDLVEGHATKVVEWIVINFGLLILHKTKVLIL